MLLERIFATAVVGPVAASNPLISWQPANGAALLWAQLKQHKEGGQLRAI
jgi:hypothetical protein